MPASGASSRMFAYLIKYYDTIKNNKKNELTENELKQVNYFFDNIENFAFFIDLYNLLKTVAGSIWCFFDERLLNLYLYLNIRQFKESQQISNN